MDKKSSETVLQNRAAKTLKDLDEVIFQVMGKDVSVSEAKTVAEKSRCIFEEEDIFYLLDLLDTIAQGRSTKDNKLKARVLILSIIERIDLDKEFVERQVLDLCHLIKDQNIKDIIADLSPNLCLSNRTSAVLAFSRAKSSLKGCMMDQAIYSPADMEESFHRGFEEGYKKCLNNREPEANLNKFSDFELE